ncbi:MAG TPA: hypothetical protein VFI61_02605 [Patescibacteria group bacterium]|nr:hypothetical protein [Patescibacteria group bacterium]
MLETPHAVVGAAIATKIPNPFIAIPLAFASHFILDKVPHWNPHIITETKQYGHPTKKSTTIIVVDSVLALILGSSIAWNALPNTGHAIVIMFGAFAAILPDLVEFPYFYFKKRSEFYIKWSSFQKSIQVDTTPFWGLLTQVITTVAAFWWIYR